MLNLLLALTLVGQVELSNVPDAYSCCADIEDELGPCLIYDWFEFRHILLIKADGKRKRAWFEFYCRHPMNKKAKKEIEHIADKYNISL